MVDTLPKRLIDLGVATEKLLLVFDRGINFTENFQAARDAMHVIASLDRQSVRRLFQIPLRRYRKVGEDTEEASVLGHST